MSFDKNAFIDFLLDNNAVGLFPEGRKLKSGRISHWYANCRSVADTAGNLEKLGNYIIDFTAEKGIDFDYFYGVPEGCTKTAVITNFLKGGKENNPGQKVIMGRGKAKEHGAPEDRFFIGAISEGDKVIVLEDVTTTGGSMFSALEGIRGTGIEVMAVVALVNRMEQTDDGTSVADKVEGLGFPYFALAQADEVLPAYVKRHSPDREVIEKIEGDFKEYGIKELGLI